MKTANASAAFAPAPNRANTTIHLAFGPLIVIPVQVFTGTEDTKVERKEFVRVPSTVDGVETTVLVPVGRTHVRKDTGDKVELEDVKRFANASNGTLVELSDEEIAQCTSPKGLAEIVAFVPTRNRSNYVAVKRDQVAPKRDNVAACRAFDLLMAALFQRKVSALVKVSVRGPAKYALLDCDGTFTTVLTHDAVRNSVYTYGIVRKSEVDMAVQLIDMIGVKTPVITDDTAPVVQKFVDAKAGGNVPTPPLAPKAAPGDLFTMLQASITNNTKEVAA